MLLVEVMNDVPGLLALAIVADQSLAVEAVLEGLVQTRGTAEVVENPG